MPAIRHLFLILLGAAMTAAAAPAPPVRVVSLNPCLDAILVAVADRNQIAALSHYARDPAASVVVEEARTLPFTYESAEEVIALSPNLVLTSQHSSLATHQALAKLGTRVELFTVPSSVEASFADIRRIAALTGHPERGEALILRTRLALKQAEPPPGAVRASALIFQPNGFAAGPGTLADEMLTRAGFTNAAKAYGLPQWGNVSLEQLMQDPPRLLLSGRAAATGASFAERLLSHPALKSLSGRMTEADFPERLLFCGGPTLIPEAQALASARRKLEARP